MGNTNLKKKLKGSTFLRRNLATKLGAEILDHANTIMEIAKTDDPTSPHFRFSAEDRLSRDRFLKEKASDKDQYRRLDAGTIAVSELDNTERIKDCGSDQKIISSMMLTTKYWEPNTDKGTRTDYAKMMARRIPLEFSDTGLSKNGPRHIYRKAVPEEEKVEFVSDLQTVGIFLLQQHADCIVKFDHDEGIIKDYIQKIILHVEGVTKPFHVMHGQDENYSKTEEDARRNKVLQLDTGSTYVPLLAKLAALGRKMLTDSGVDLDTTTLYDITLNISTCAVPPHVDEPNREGCGAYIVNFPTEDALISFESAWNDEEHAANETLQDAYVFKCKSR